MDAFLAGVSPLSFKPTAIGWTIHPISFSAELLHNRHENNHVIEYFDAPDIKKRILEMIDVLRFDHVDPERVHCVRSRGSKAKNTIARIHGLGRIWQEALSMEPTYILEIIHEQFDYYPREAQDRTLIHELMHIPQGFRGGFRHHDDHVTVENVDTWHRRYLQRRRDLGLDKV